MISYQAKAGILNVDYISKAVRSVLQGTGNPVSIDKSALSDPAFYRWCLRALTTVLDPRAQAAAKRVFTDEECFFLDTLLARWVLTQEVLVKRTALGGEVSARLRGHPVPPRRCPDHHGSA